MPIFTNEMRSEFPFPVDSDTVTVMMMMMMMMMNSEQHGSDKVNNRNI